MMLEGSVVQDLSLIPKRKPAASHIYEYSVTQERDDSKI